VAGCFLGRSVRGFDDLQPWLVSRCSVAEEPPDPAERSG